MKNTIKERIAVLETKMDDFSKKISNHCSAHLIDRIIQSITLCALTVVIFLLKIVVFK